MGDDLGEFGRLHAIVKREVEVEGHLRPSRHCGSRGERPGRFQRSPKTASSVYLARAGDTARMGLALRAANLLATY